MMKTDETNPRDFEKKVVSEHSHIKGWGIDADPKNDPTYPIKNRKNIEQEGYSWERPPQQPATEEILRSVERPNLTATFGTSVPPSGFSGSIRRMAYKYSESSYGRWLPLLLADRIHSFEGIVNDLKKGHVPNIFAERGWKSEWKYNRTAFVKKIAVTAIVATAVIGLCCSKRNKRKTA